MTIFTVGDRYALVEHASLRALALLRDSLAARPEGYKYMRAYRTGHWDGYVHLLKDSMFPSGLLPLATRTLQRAEEPVEFVDTRNIPAIVLPNYDIPDFTFREYQKEAVQAVLTHQRGVLKMATNAGKTLVMAGILKSLEGKQAIVVVPTRALLTQTADRLEAMLHTRLGRYGAGYEEFHTITVSTIASMGKLLSQEDGVKDNYILLADETHHCRSKTLFDGIMATPGPYRIGLSGTPLRYNKLDDMKLVGATGEVIYEVSNTQLIEAGFSVPPIVIFHSVGDGEEDKREYQDAYRDLLVNNEDRNRLIACVAMEEIKRGPVLILANWIEHVNAIASALPGNTSSRVITGNNTSEEMTQALDAVRERKLDILIATDVFGEGIDVPSVATVVLASGGKSHIKMLQRIGRGMRVDGLKEELHVHDFIDDTHKYLLKHSERRYSIYAKEGFRTKLDNATGTS